MYIRPLFILILCLLNTLNIQAQQLTVKTMSMDASDISASKYVRKDLNGKACALVKVQLAVYGAEFEGNIIGDVAYKTGEYWVYMTEGSRELRIKHLNFVPLHVNFSMYGFKGLKSLSTYDLTLFIPQTSSPFEQQKLTINYSPANAMVLIDSKLYKGDGCIEAILPVGSHNYIIAAEGYDTVEGSIKLTASTPRTITEHLVVTVQAPIQPIAQQDAQEDEMIEGKTPTQIRNMGYDYLYGTDGKKKDYAKAMKYAFIASERGNTDAMVDIGLMYDEGLGVQKDKEEAIKWFRKAAEQGNAVGQYNLADCYQYGTGVSVDLSQAKYWYWKAAEQDYEDAKKQFEKLNSTSNASKQKMKLLQPTILFSLGKSTIEKNQYANIEKIAKYMKEIPTAKVLIVGNSLPEGDMEKNKALAEARANAVKNTLINKYKINRNRLIIKGQSERVSEDSKQNSIVMFYIE